MSSGTHSRGGVNASLQELLSANINCSNRCPIEKLSSEGATEALSLNGEITLDEESKSVAALDKVIREGILNLAKSRGPTKSICPSEVSRKIFPASCWRQHMPLVRSIGFSLAEEGILLVSQRNQIIPPEDFSKIRGPIRFKIQDQQ